MLSLTRHRFLLFIVSDTPLDFNVCTYYASADINTHKLLVHISCWWCWWWTISSAARQIVSTFLWFFFFGFWLWCYPKRGRGRMLIDCRDHYRTRNWRKRFVIDGLFNCFATIASNVVVLMQSIRCNLKSMARVWESVGDEFVAI